MGRKYLAIKQITRHGVTLRCIDSPAVKPWVQINVSTFYHLMLDTLMKESLGMENRRGFVLRKSFCDVVYDQSK